MAPATAEILVRNHSFTASFPFREGNPQTWAGVTWIHKVGRSRLLTHTVSSTPIALVENANWESARERDGYYLLLGQAKEAGYCQP